MSKENTINFENSLRKNLKLKYKLTEDQIDKIIEKIDFNCNVNVHFVNDPQTMRMFITLEHIVKDMYMSASEFDNSCYGVIKDPNIPLNHEIKVAIQEKKEMMDVIENPEDTLKLGEVEIINGTKDLKVRAQFDPYKTYIGVKKITHKIEAIFKSEYSEYEIIIYVPNKKIVKRYLKYKNFVDQIIK